MKTPHEIALLIADDLFHTGTSAATGNPVERLICRMPGGHDGGGWCQAAVVDRVETILQREMARKAGLLRRPK